MTNKQLLLATAKLVCLIVNLVGMATILGAWIVVVINYARHLLPESDLLDASLVLIVFVLLELSATVTRIAEHVIRVHKEKEAEPSRLEPQQ